MSHQEVESSEQVDYKRQKDTIEERAEHATSLFWFTIIYGCFDAVFIISDLVYAYQETTCVDTIPDGFSFNLSVWLKVDAYLRIGIVALLFLGTISACRSASAIEKCTVCLICIFIIYGLFSVAWTIVGSVMFWGKLNSE